MIDYVTVERSTLDRLVDVHVRKGAVGRVSGHFLVKTKVKGGSGFRGRRKWVQCKEVINVSES